MKFSPRRHLSYANVAATLALVFAMSGGALAASHYLINSTKQINPRVLHKLRGRRGPAGIQGLSIQGPSGAPGLRGAKGDPGREGPAGLSSLSTLPSGRTENGVYGIEPDNSATSGTLREAVAFPLPLAAAIPPANIKYTPVASATADCPGRERSAPGFLCIYSAGSSGVGAPTVLETEDGLSKPGTGRFGFTLNWVVTAPAAGDQGTFSVTAP